MHSDFYSSKQWERFRKVIILERLHDDGLTYCEYCQKPILKPYDCIAHHKIALTDFNINDTNISLNPENIMLVHHRCHNLIHNKLGKPQQNVYIVYGSPCSGKSTYVRDNMEVGDLIVDMDNIWQCISGCDKYIKPEQLKANVFAVRNLLIDNIKLRVGNWSNAYIVGGYPLVSERERLSNQLGARLIYIDTSKEECISRLENNPQGRNITEWRKYIEDWWEKFQR
ncbi:MAG: HNH endonuclease [Ruminococcus sp.]|nr:HNH endonuclease [Ruminococcus sp.]